MTLWRRIKLLARSWLHGLQTSGDPVRALERRIQTLKDQLPLINENLERIRGHLARLEEEHGRLDDQQRTLATEIEAALQRGDREQAVHYAANLKSVRSRCERVAERLELTRDAHQQAQALKDRHTDAIERKSREAAQAARDARRARWQQRTAQSVTTHRGPQEPDSTDDELIERIEHTAAEAEAHLDVALGQRAGDAGLDEDVQRHQAEALVADFQRALPGAERGASHDAER